MVLRLLTILALLWAFMPAMPADALVVTSADCATDTRLSGGAAGVHACWDTTLKTWRFSNGTIYTSKSQFNVEDFGGNPADNGVEDTTAVQDTLDAVYAHNVAYAHHYDVHFKPGTYLLDRIIFKGQTMTCDGEPESCIIIGKPKKDVFYAPDPSIGETGSIQHFPANWQVKGFRIIIDNSQAPTLPPSASPDFYRPVFPVKAAWAATTAYLEDVYIRNAAGTKIYRVTTAGTSGSVEPSHTRGRARDGTVVWEYVYQGQIYLANAAFAFPNYDGSVTNWYITDAHFKDTRIEPLDNTKKYKETAIYSQRPFYRPTFENFKPYFTTAGLIIVPPTVNFDNLADEGVFAPHAGKISQSAFANQFPLIIYNASYWSWVSPNLYENNTGDHGPFILQYRAHANGHQVEAWTILNMQLELQHTQGPQAIFHGLRHNIVGGNLGGDYADGGSDPGFITWGADGSTMQGVTLGTNTTTAALVVSGNRNTFIVQVNDINDKTNFFTDQGHGNVIAVASATGHEFEAGRLEYINQPRPPSWVTSGEFATEGMARTPFLNKPDLLLTPGEWMVEAVTGFTLTKDTSVSVSKEYVTLLGHGDGAFSKVHRQSLTIGREVPHTKVRVWAMVRASAGKPNQMLSVEAPASTARGSKTVTLSTSWQVFQFDADLDAASVGDVVVFRLRGTSTNVPVDVAWVAFQPIPVDLAPRVSANNGDAAKTLTVGVDEQTQQWATALTTARAVTLSTTNAYNGARFLVVRAATATGAFNLNVLNVGTGPLIALLPGTWGAFEYSGSAWVLTGYGTLAAPSRTDVVQFYPAVTFCQSDTPSGALVPVRIAKGDWALARRAARAENHNIICYIPAPTRTSSGKGYKLTAFKIAQQITVANLTSNTFNDLSTTTYVNNTSNAVVDYGGRITITMPTATQTNPYLTAGTVGTAAFMNTADAQINFDWTVVMQKAGIYRLYGISASWTEQE